MTIVLFTCFLFESTIAVDMVVLKQSLSPVKRYFLLLQWSCFGLILLWKTLGGNASSRSLYLVRTIKRRKESYIGYARWPWYRGLFPFFKWRLQDLLLQAGVYTVLKRTTYLWVTVSMSNQCYKFHDFLSQQWWQDWMLPFLSDRF